MEILAEEFTATGHQVKVATQVATESERNYDYEVVRLPPLKSCVQLLRWSDVCLCAGVSLRGLVPIMLAGTPLVISHQETYNSPGRFSHRAGVEEDGDSVQQQYMLQPSGTVTHSGAVGRNS